MSVELAEKWTGGVDAQKRWPIERRPRGWQSGHRAAAVKICPTFQLVHVAGNLSVTVDMLHGSNSGHATPINVNDTTLFSDMSTRLQ